MDWESGCLARRHTHGRTSDHNLHGEHFLLRRQSLLLSSRRACGTRACQRHALVRDKIAYVHLLASENQSLLRWRDAFLLFDSLLDSLDLVCWLNVQFDLCAVTAVSRNGLKLVTIALYYTKEARNIPLPVRVLTLINIFTSHTQLVLCTCFRSSE